MQFGNQAIIEAGIDKMSADDRIELAAQLVGSVIVNAGAVVGIRSATVRSGILEAFEDALDDAIMLGGGCINTALLNTGGN
jgi:hypothetical protein